MRGRAAACAALALLALAAGRGYGAATSDFAAEIRVAHQIRPYTMIIVTEPAARARAEEARTTILGAEPYRRMGNQLEVRIVEGDAARMDCHGGHAGIERLVTCKDDYVAAVGAAHAAHQVLAVTNAADGGSGGPIPVLGGPTYPAYTLLHELGHAYGLADEYEYESLAERVAQCRPPLEKPNSVHFAPRASYASDAEARQAHRAQIPWYHSIAASTLITTDRSLGTATGIYPVATAGLFRGGNCNREVPTWKPYATANFMTTLDGDGAGIVPAIHAAHIHQRMQGQRGLAIALIDVVTAADPSAARVSETRGPAPEGAGGRTGPSGAGGGGARKGR